MIDLRDLQVALDVAQRAELGWFDVEFTVYGCSYLLNGKRYYRLSSEAEKIYDFIELGIQNNLLPTNIEKLTKKYSVPVGMKEEIARSVKQELALQLKDEFSTEFFLYLQEVAELATEERAFTLLEDEWDAIENSFDADKLQDFENLVNYAYRCRKLSMMQYQQLKNNISEERKNMEEMIISKDIFEKDYYGIAYESLSGIRYISNARKATVYKKKYDLEQQGLFVTPLFTKKYWYNYTLRLPQVHQIFETELKRRLNQKYLMLMQQISKGNQKISKAEFLNQLNFVADHFGKEAAKTLQQYGYRWGILYPE